MIYKLIYIFNFKCFKLKKNNHHKTFNMEILVITNDIYIRLNE